MVMVDEQKLFFLAVDFGNESSLDPLLIFVAGADKSQKLLVLDLKNGTGDLGRFKWLKLEFFLLTTGSYDDFDRLDLVATADELLEVNRQSLLVLVMRPFKVGRRAGIEVRDMTAVGAVLGMVVASMIVLLGRFGISTLGVPVVMPSMIVPSVVMPGVIVVVGSRTGLGATGLRGIAPDGDRDACNQAQCDPVRNFHGRFFLKRWRLGA